MAIRAPTRTRMAVRMVAVKRHRIKGAVGLRQGPRTRNTSSKLHSPLRASPRRLRLHLGLKRGRTSRRKGEEWQREVEWE